jgi:hypothetical protein
MDRTFAAIVLTPRAARLSCKLRGFGRVPGLQIEDWTR